MMMEDVCGVSSLADFFLLEKLAILPFAANFIDLKLVEFKIRDLEQLGEDSNNLNH